MSAPTHTNPNSAPAKKARVVVNPLARNAACDNCRARKVRCSGERPACAACLKVASGRGENPEQVVCSYSLSPDKGSNAGPRKGSGTSTSSNGSSSSVPPPVPISTSRPPPPNSRTDPRSYSSPVPTGTPPYDPYAYSNYHPPQRYPSMDNPSVNPPIHTYDLSRSPTPSGTWAPDMMYNAPPPPVYPPQWEGQMPPPPPTRSSTGGYYPPPSNFHPGFTEGSQQPTRSSSQSWGNAGPPYPESYYNRR